MRQLPNMLRLLICSLLIGGYGAMYSGSILHELSHQSGIDSHAAAHSCASDEVSACAEASHDEVSCFFCAHAPVVAGSSEVAEVWAATTSTQLELTLPTSGLLTAPVALPALRGPPSILS